METKSRMLLLLLLPLLHLLFFLRGRRPPLRSTRCGSILFLLLIVVMSSGRSEASIFQTRKIQQDILKGYNVLSSPPADVTVYPDVTFNQCPELSTDGILTSHLKEHYEWTDNRLIWNSSNYSDAKEIEIPLYRLWAPDIKLSSSSTDVTGGGSLRSSSEDHNFKARVSSNGVVSVEKTSLYSTRCYYSSDVENALNCYLRFGSMEILHSGKALKMQRFECDSDLFGKSDDQCRTVVLRRTKNIDSFQIREKNGPTFYWYVVTLTIVKN